MSADARYHFTAWFEIGLHALPRFVEEGDPVLRLHVVLPGRRLEQLCRRLVALLVSVAAHLHQTGKAVLGVEIALLRGLAIPLRRLERRLLLAVGAELVGKPPTYCASSSPALASFSFLAIGSFCSVGLCVWATTGVGAAMSRPRAARAANVDRRKIMGAVPNAALLRTVMPVRS